MNIDDFVQEGERFGPIPLRQLDHKKIMELSDEDFEKFYLALMTEYKDKDGWWRDGESPHCSKCSEEIREPKELRRYYGRSLHPNCFKNVYGKERRGLKSGERRYWDKVAALEL